MIVGFRVDASSKMGIGHLMRCLALAQLLDEVGIETCFFMKDETRAIALSRHDWMSKIHVVPAFSDQLEEVDWLAQQHGFDEMKALVLDGYQFTSAYRQALKSALNPSTRFVLLDDTNNSGPLFADVVINSADNADLLNYKQTAPQAKLCLGTAYRVLRREFSILPQPAFSMRNSLSIMMGGSDVNNLSIQILKALDEVGFDGPIRVLTGAAYPNNEELEALIKASSLTIQHLPNCQQVAEVFCSSRLAISAAGSTQFELLACSTPTILLTVADNQIPATRAAVEQGWCQSLDAQGGIAVDMLVKQIDTLWYDEKQLEAMSVKAKHIAELGSINEQALMSAVVGE